MSQTSVLLLFSLILAGCASKRVVMLENKLLHADNAGLVAEIEELKDHAHPPEDFTKNITMEVLTTWLERAGHEYGYQNDGAHIQISYSGVYTDFTVNIQHFADAEVLFIATGDYLSLNTAQDTDSITLLLVQIATINYELLVGKLQLDPETGDVMLSVELLLDQGLAFGTFERALQQLQHTADTRYPELERALSGTGL